MEELVSPFEAGWLRQLQLVRALWVRGELREQLGNDFWLAVRASFATLASPNYAYAEENLWLIPKLRSDFEILTKEFQGSTAGGRSFNQLSSSLESVKDNIAEQALNLASLEGLSARMGKAHVLLGEHFSLLKAYHGYTNRDLGFGDVHSKLMGFYRTPNVESMDAYVEASIESCEKLRNSMEGNYSENFHELGSEIEELETKLLATSLLM